MAKRRDPNSAHYIDNKEFLAKISAYREARIEAEESGEDKPQVTNYIGECFVKIANHLAYKSNFVNYTFRDEMILDGIENCLTYMDNFDPAKSTNPFAYFTQLHTMLSSGVSKKKNDKWKLSSSILRAWT